MTLLSRLGVSLCVVLSAAPPVWAVDIWTVGVNNTRQGWNSRNGADGGQRAQTEEDPRVRRRRKDRRVAARRRRQALCVHDDEHRVRLRREHRCRARAGASSPRRSTRRHRQPAGAGMDLHNIYHSWGITATPVIDVATNTIYVTTFGKPNAGSPNTERNNMLWILDADTLADKQPPVLIAGNADNGGGGISNGFTTPYQKLRAGLGLLTDAGGNKAVVDLVLDQRREPARPGHGFVVAYDVRGLNREAGFTPTPAIWNVTPGGGAGGIWMSGSGPAIDGNDIYLATGNGMDPGTMAGNFGESFVKLRYTAGVAGVDNGKPKLAVADFWGAFSDFGRADEDQDLGAAGVFLIPERRQPDRRRQGRHPLQPRTRTTSGRTAGIRSSICRSSPPICPTRRTAPPACPRPPPPIRTGRSSIAIATCRRRRRPARPITSTARRSTWSARRRASSSSGVRTSASRPTTSISPRSASPAFRAEGTQFASGHMPAPGGMPGGRLVVSSNGTTAGTGVVWGVYPTQGNANSNVVHGALVAYDATAVVNGKLKQLFHSDANPANDMGNFAKYSTPVVANGKVYVATFSNKVVQYGL